MMRDILIVLNAGTSSSNTVGLTRKGEQIAVAAIPTAI